jgi:hypothetical protein
MMLRPLDEMGVVQETGQYESTIALYPRRRSYRTAYSLEKGEPPDEKTHTVPQGG